MYKLYCTAPNRRRVLIARGGESQMIRAKNADMKALGYASYCYQIVKG
jgi:hypothetical protein